VKNPSIAKKLRKLRTDYQNVVGEPFLHFYCPFLFRDEDVPLCKGHIVNAAFKRSSRRWTVQRIDVDNFFGSNFEADFLGIRYREGLNPGKVLVSHELAREYRPRILKNGEPIDYFRLSGSVPSEFTPVLFQAYGKSVPLGLKIEPKAFRAGNPAKWEVIVAKDMRLPAFVSLLKAAHLTLFDMLGYRYVLSAAGHFLGHTILGSFFIENANRVRSEVISSATAHFKQFVHMMRPIMSSSPDVKGTVVDRTLLICRSERTSPWAVIVFIRTSQALHAVMVPAFGEIGTVSQFLRFLEDGEETIGTSRCYFDGDEWLMSPEIRDLRWPKTGILFP